MTIDEEINSSESRVIKVCPKCELADISPLNGRIAETDHNWYCKGCSHRFQSPKETETRRTQESTNSSGYAQQLEGADPDEFP